jgi:hypothetical protein
LEIPAYREAGEIGEANSFMVATHRYIAHYYLTRDVRKLAALKLVDKWGWVL